MSRWLFFQDDANMFDGPFAFMENSDGKEDEEKVTLLDLK